MEPVIVTISHSLGKDEVLQRLRPVLGQASRSFRVLEVEHEVWDGDRMDCRVRAMGQVVTGNIQVFEKHVRVEASLPWLLAKFAATIQQTIAGRGQVLLEKK